MIASLMPTHLYWVGIKGVARLNGTSGTLEGMPHISTEDVVAIDYAPGLCAMVLPRHGGWRDMTPQEVQAAQEVLRTITHQPDAKV